MKSVIIGIGSNLGERTLNCKKALEGISGFSNIARVSSFYETEPVGMEDQPSFINCVVEVETELSPHGLLDSLKAVENNLGRERKEKWGPRTIDLDIIFYGNEIINDPDLKIPHPEAHVRRFVLEPLAEIAPEHIDPVLKLSVTELLSRLHDPKIVVKLDRPSTLIPQ